MGERQKLFVEGYSQAEPEKRTTLSFEYQSLVFLSSLKILLKLKKKYSPRVSRPLCRGGEPRPVGRGNGWPVFGSGAAGHCAPARPPAWATSPNHEGTLPALIKKENLGKTGADEHSEGLVPSDLF